MAERVTMLSHSGNYIHVRYGNTFGYVQSRYISRQPFRQFTAYVSTYSLNVRSQASASANLRGTLRMSSSLTVLGRGNKYALIRSGKLCGFVLKSALRTTLFRPYAAMVIEDAVPLCRTAGKTETSFQKLAKGDRVTVLGKGTTYSLVTKDGAIGFVTGRLLQAIQPVSYDQQPMNQQFGIDVSHYQGTINFNAVKQSGNSFVIVKTTDGQHYVDPTFERNSVAASQAGLTVHAYHFFRAKTSADAIKEADRFVTQIKRVTAARHVSPTYLFLDVETTNGIGTSALRTVLTNNVITFFNRLRAAGFNRLGIYSNLNFFQTAIDLSRIQSAQPAQPRFLLWLARYRDQALGPGFSADIWQYTSSGKVNGVVGAVDQNISYYNSNGL